MSKTRLFLKYHGLVKINQIYFFLRRLPILRKKLPSSPPVGERGKKAFVGLGILYRILSCLVSSAILMAFYYFPWKSNVFSLVGLPPQDATSGFFQSFFFLSILSGPFIMRQGRQELDWTGYYFLKTFRFPARDFFLSRISLNLLRISLGLLLPMLFMGWFLGDFPRVLLAYVTSLFMRFFLETFFLWLYEKRGKTKLEKAWVSVLLGLVMGIFAFLPFLGQGGKLMIYVTFPFSLLGAIWGSTYLKKANFEALASGLATTEELTASATAMEGASFQDVKMEEEDIAREGAPGDGTKKGYDYLHELIFFRIQKKLDRHIKIKVRVVLFLGLLLLIAGINFKEIMVEEIDVLFLMVLRSSFFLSYMFSPGERFAKLLFLYMDKDLLPFHYYREPRAILTCLKIRLLKLLRITAPITLAMLASFLLFFGLFYKELGMKILLLIPVLLIQGAFFALYRLMVYYLLQPYTLKMEAKSPGAALANAVVYLVSYLFFQIKEIGPISVAILCGVMALIALFAPFLLKAWGPKSFKLREG